MKITIINFKLQQNVKNEKFSFSFGQMNTRFNVEYNNPFLYQNVQFTTTETDPLEQPVQIQSFIPYVIHNFRKIRAFSFEYPSENFIYLSGL